MNGEPDRTAEDELASDPGATVSEVAAEPGGSAESDELAAARALADDNWNKYLRAAAELENVRKRAARDVENAHKFALERFATDLLAVCDSLEMALTMTDDANIESYREGSEATLKLLGTVMQRFGVDQIDPIGDPFDPTLHEAMTTQPTDELEPGRILTVFQKGYALNGRLLRPARVVVAAEPAEQAEKG